MDDLPLPSRPGGTVEPTTPAVAAASASRTRTTPDGPRFELRDMTAEVMYHARTFDEMVEKANRAGAIRFTAIDAEGRRSCVHKADGVWQRPAWLAPEVTTSANAPAKALPEPDAERAALVARLEASLNERYVIRHATLSIGDRPIGHTEYLWRGDTSRVAFTESAFRLSTDTNSPSVARSMVDVAETRRWQALRVSGHEDFRRMVWLEASVRGVRTVGYEPVAGDLELLRRDRDARMVNRVEPTILADAPTSGGKSSGRDSGGSKTVLAAIEAVLVAQRVPEKRREAIMSAARQGLTRRVATGEMHRVKIYDRERSRERMDVGPTVARQRVQERGTPVR